jgi:hypothetical protein
MLLGKVREAINFINRKSAKGVLHFDEKIPVTLSNSKSTLELLKEKHPSAKTPNDQILLPKGDNLPSGPQE